MAEDENEQVVDLRSDLSDQGPRHVLVTNAVAARAAVGVVRERLGKASDDELRGLLDLALRRCQALERSVAAFVGETDNGPTR